MQSASEEEVHDASCYFVCLVNFVDRFMPPKRQIHE